MKLGIIGKGMIVKEVLGFLPELDIEYVSILGRKEAEEETRVFAEAHGLDGYHVDYEEMLASEIDTVYIAIPNNLHFPYAKQALLAGKNVIVEKPMVMSFAELRELREIAEENKLILLEAMNIHHLEAVWALEEAINEIGRIRLANFNISSYSSRYDAFRQGEILHTFDPEQGGGALMDANVYNLHLAVGLFGAPEEGHYLANTINGVDTSGIMLLDYDSFIVSCLAAKDSNSLNYSTIQGEDGYILLEKPISQLTEFKRISNDKTVTEYVFDTPIHRLYPEFVEFIRIITEQDFEAAEYLLDLSTIVCMLLEAGLGDTDFELDEELMSRDIDKMN